MENRIRMGERYGSLLLYVTGVVTNGDLSNYLRTAISRHANDEEIKEKDCAHTNTKLNTKLKLNCTVSYLSAGARDGHLPSGLNHFG
jgi:hypothetical protein